MQLYKVTKMYIYLPDKLFTTYISENQCCKTLRLVGRLLLIFIHMGREIKPVNITPKVTILKK